MATFGSVGSPVTAAQMQQFKTLATLYQHSRFSGINGVHQYAPHVPTYSKNGSITASGVQAARTMIFWTRSDLGGGHLDHLPTFSAGRVIKPAELITMLSDGHWTYNHYNCHYNECNASECNNHNESDGGECHNVNESDHGESDHSESDHSESDHSECDYGEDHLPGIYG